MELNQINEENSSECNTDNNDGSSAGSSYTCEMCQNAITDNRELTEMLEVQESIICEVAENRKRELDGIQEDLNNLIGSLNNFIADNIEEYDSEGEPESEDTDEKKDGPQEKELRKMGKVYDEIYTTDGMNPPEINWNHLAPILQKHVTDLKRLHNLNALTTSVMQRIKKITQLKQAIKELEEKQH